MKPDTQHYVTQHNTTRSSVVMLSVIYAKCRKIGLYAECRHGDIENIIYLFY
jgi:hypothetical protein